MHVCEIAVILKFQVKFNHTNKTIQSDDPGLLINLSDKHIFFKELGSHFKM